MSNLDTLTNLYQEVSSLPPVDKDQVTEAYLKLQEAIQQNPFPITVAMQMLVKEAEVSVDLAAMQEAKARGFNKIPTWLDVKDGRP